MGRHAIGNKPMTPAERQRRRRKRLAASAPALSDDDVTALSEHLPRIANSRGLRVPAGGRPRTNNEKRSAVMTMLENPEWQRWSSREIARRCGVSPAFVAKLRGEQSGNVPSSKRTYKDKYGNTSTMHIENIGGKPAAASPVCVREK